MFNKSLQYSVAAQKREWHRVMRVVLTVVMLFILYNAIHSFLFSVWVIRGDSMQPGIRSGDRLLVVSSRLPFLFAGITGGDIPYRHGHLVLVDKSRPVRHNRLLIVADSVVRFFTAQQVSVIGGGEHLHVKRIAALPGDEISMANFVMRVRPAGTPFALTEFELAVRPYYPTIPQMPELWDMTLPFSGYMNGIVLGPGQSFVVSDDRSDTNDSRTWGPVDTRTIVGRPVFRFWPPSRIGIP